jgi:hypothetical protein
MKKKLTKTGNSLALVLDRPLLAATGIDADTPLEVSTGAGRRAWRSCGAAPRRFTGATPECFGGWRADALPRG